MGSLHAVDTRGRAASSRGAVFLEQHPQLSRLVDRIVGPAGRGVRNVARSPVRLALVAAILGISLMFVAVMVALNASVQQRLATAQDQIGTGITISPAGSGGFGGFGGFGGSSNTATQYITANQVKTVESTVGVNSITEYITTRDSEGTIKGAIPIPTNIPSFGGGGAGGGAGGTGAGSRFGGAVDGTIPPTIQGLLPGQSPLTLANGVPLTLKSGRNFTTADATGDVALTSQALATANGYAVGSTITLNGTKLTLVGLFTASDAFDNNTIILPLQTAQHVYSITGVTGVMAYADTVADVNTVASSLRNSLGSSLDVVSQAQISADTIDALHTTQSTIETTLVISALVAACVIIFAVFLIVRERTQEIGLLRAIGASRLQIVGQFAVETLALGFAAAVAATILIALLGGTLARQFSTATAGGGGATRGGRIFTGGRGFTPPAGGFGGFGARFGGAATRALSAGLTPTTALIIFALGIGLAILASVIPAWYVTRVRPATALRAIG